VGFLRDEHAAGLVEYSLIIAIIAVGAIIAMIFLREQLVNVFSHVGNNVKNGACMGPNQLGQCP
jgi:Flp pilus assembly pilin Flp